MKITLFLFFTSLSWIVCGQNKDAQLDSITPSVTSSNIDTTVNKRNILSLAELANVRISPASLTDLKSINTPASITVITAEDIKNTPVRNLNDLIEVYVPGAFWMNHHGGQRLGIRGVISDRNHKFLLLVNGVNMGQKAKNGVSSELECWDLDDIEKIEIVRGPGAVTYGPGAIMGVINIITKNGLNSEDGLQSNVSTTYLSKYNSIGASFDITYKKGKISSYTFGSIRSTSGFAPEAYTVENKSGEYGFVGKDFTSGAFFNEPTDYFADFDNIPQVKIHSQINTANGWELFGRYTHSGTSVNGIVGKGVLQTGYSADSTALYGEPFNQYQMWNQHLTFSLKKETKFNDKFTVTGSAIYDNENYERRISQVITYDLSDDPGFVFDEELYASATNINHARRKKASFSEEEITLKTVAFYNPNTKLSTALGVEMVKNKWAAPWGKDERDLKLGEKGVIISDTNSYSFGDEQYMTPDETAHYVGDGWSTITLSTYGEIKYTFWKELVVLASGRLDKNEYSKLLFSPRLAIISQLNSKNSFRLIYQISNRMNTSEQLYVQNYTNIKTNPEKLENLEFIYTGLPTKNIVIDFSSYVSKLNVLGWVNNSTDNLLMGSTERSGDMSLFGAELGIKFKLKKIILGINHSYVKLLNWELADGVQSSGTSYSDYDRPLEYIDDDGNKQFIQLNGQGSNLNNWANNSTKLYLNYQPIEKLNIHVNSQVFYGFKGAQDGLDMYLEAVDTISNAETYKSKLNEMMNDFSDEKVYQFQARINLSISYQIGDNLQFSVYAFNIASINNKRYSYDTGNRFTFPNRVAFVKEPSFYGAKVTCTF